MSALDPQQKSASNATHAQLSVVLREDEMTGRLEDQRRFELLNALLDAGHGVTRATASDETSGATPAGADDSQVLAVLQESLPAELAAETANGARFEVSGLSAEEVRTRVEGLRTEKSLPEPGAWTPWFPVIDYQRCTNCMQCLSFCLFDVYGVDEQGSIQVRNEDKCKTNCPACSRVCPEVAILFPKYKNGPINGDEVRAEDVASESMKVDISALLGGDIYSTLRERHTGARKRFSTERDESKALLERKRCLKKLGDTLDIPAEVLMSLPSAGEIEERARRAQEKMARRRAVSQSVKDAEGDAKPAPSPKEWGI